MSICLRNLHTKKLVDCTNFPNNWIAGALLQFAIFEDIIRCHQIHCQILLFRVDYTKYPFIPDTVVKCICSNENCNQSPYMHTACFQTFEESVLTFLKGQGRARSWSDKQKYQNLWTKRGYDLVYKACDCLCGHGHLRKDLDWVPMDLQMGPADLEGPNGTKRKRKKSKSSGGKPTITIGLPNFAMATSQVQMLSFEMGSRYDDVRRFLRGFDILKFFML